MMGYWAQHLKEILTYKERKKLPPKAFVFPERRAWPIHDKKHALIAINYMRRGRGYADDYDKVAKEIGKRYPDLKDEAKAAAREGKKIAPKRPKKETKKKRKLAAWRECVVYGDALLESIDEGLPMLRPPTEIEKAPPMEIVRIPAINQLTSYASKLEGAMSKMRAVIRSAKTPEEAEERIVMIMQQVIEPMLTFYTAFMNEAVRKGKSFRLPLARDLQQLNMLARRLSDGTAEVLGTLFMKL